MCRYGNQHTLAVNLVAMKIRSFFGLKKVKNQTHCEVLENLGCSYHVCGVVCLVLQWWMIFGAFGGSSIVCDSISGRVVHLEG